MLKRKWIRGNKIASFDGLIRGIEELQIGGRAETIQIAVLLRLTRMLRRVLETCRNRKDLAPQNYHHASNNESPEDDQEEDW